MGKLRWNAYIVLTLLITSSTAISGCGSGVRASGAAAGIPAVSVVKLGALSGAQVSGKVAPSEQVQVVSKMSGKVSEVRVSEGTAVKKGDLLIQLENEDLLQQVRQAEAGLQAAQAKLADTLAGAREQDIRSASSLVDQAAAAVKQAEAALEQAQAAFDLGQKLYNQIRNRYDSGEITKADLDKAELDYEKVKTARDQANAACEAAKAQLASAQAKLDLLKSGATANTIAALEADVERGKAAVELAKNSAANAEIRSPLDGIVVKRSIEPGEMAQPGAALLTIVNMAKVEVQASVPENLISRVKEGAELRIRISNLPDRTFKGIVTFASPVSDPNSSTFPVKLAVDNEDGAIRAGTVAEVELGGTQSPRLEVPKSALFQQENQTFIFKLDGDKVRRIAVETVEKNADWVYLRGDAPLRSGDSVVIDPPAQLADGTIVHVK